MKALLLFHYFQTKPIISILIYVMNILDYEVKFQIRNKTAFIISTDIHQKP